VIAGVGRLAPVKDHHTLISTMTRVIQRHRDATLLIAGDGELRGKLEQRARALLRDQVIFAGWVRDLPTLYAACDVVALTSRNEGTPIALIEAAAAGKPVVATDVGGVSEVVRDGFTGRLCAAGDDRAIAAALVALLDSPATAHAMGEQAAAWVTPRFAQERLVRDIDELYGELLGRASARVLISIPISGFRAPVRPVR
jgi:glycosyltransferase involved in cell wall biosynthesis